MRKQFVKTLDSILEIDKKVILLLGDIGVFGFNKSFIKYPERVYNMGILEQSMVGVAAGLSLLGLIPTVHTIAPFLVDRVFEQLKLDFGYQKLAGNFVTVGGSYDYAALGATHHCPEDVSLIKNIPNFNIFIPGNKDDFDILYNSNYNNNLPNYFRLSEFSHNENIKTNNNPIKIKDGKLATIITICPMLSKTINACKNFDVTILYYTTLAPFNEQAIKDNYNKNIIVIEPFFEGTLSYDLSFIRNSNIYYIGVPRMFLNNYGTAFEHDVLYKLDEKSIKERIHNIICSI
jgi:transketolase